MKRKKRTGTISLIVASIAVLVAALVVGMLYVSSQGCNQKVVPGAKSYVLTDCGG